MTAGELVTYEPPSLVRVYLNSWAEAMDADGQVVASGHVPGETWATVRGCERVIVGNHAVGFADLTAAQRAALDDGRTDWLEAR